MPCYAMLRGRGDGVTRAAKRRMGCWHWMYVDARCVLDVAGLGSIEDARGILRARPNSRALLLNAACIIYVRCMSAGDIPNGND